MQAVLVLLSSLIDIRKGEVTSLYKPEDWNEKFKFSASPVIPEGVVVVIGYATALLKANKMAIPMLRDGKTVQGPPMYEVWTDVVQNISMRDYFLLHSTVVMHMFRFYQTARSKQFLIPRGRFKITAINGQQENLMPAECVKVLLTDDSVPETSRHAWAAASEILGHFPMLWLGNAPRKIASKTVTDPSVKEVLKEIAEGNAFRGGKTAGMGGIVSTFGFTALQSEGVKNTIVTAAIALEILTQNPKMKVDIDAEAGNAPILYSTMTAKAPDADWRLIMNRGDIRKVGDVVAAKTLQTVRDDSHFVVNTQTTLPSCAIDDTAELKHQTKAIEGLDLISKSSKSYTAVVPILSDVFWKQIKCDKEGYANDSKAKVDGITMPNYVYEFRPVYDAIGIVSTCPLKITGNSFFAEQKSWRGWRERIIAGNRFANTFFMAPVKIYQAWSGILVPKSKGCRVIFSDEDGWSLQKILSVADEEKMSTDHGLDGDMISYGDDAVSVASVRKGSTASSSSSLMTSLVSMTTQTVGGKAPVQPDTATVVSVATAPPEKINYEENVDASYV